jgi:hypothetical protein
MKACLTLLLLALLWLLPATPALAQLQVHNNDDGTAVVRSLESLRDLDNQAWQLVAYRQGEPGGELRLRVVGFPGKVRLNHPTSLIVSSGLQHWELSDVTLQSALLADDGRDAAAEFDLAPMLAELQRNQPLRLQLPGVFTELPVPPFVVKEWRELPTLPL